MKAPILNNNAKKIEYNGIKFKSTMEANVYQLFEKEGILLEYEPKKFILQPSFNVKDITSNVEVHTPLFKNRHKVGYGINESFRSWTYTPDFIYKRNNVFYIIECKGQITKDFEYKWRMFIKELSENNDNETIYKIFLIQRIGEAKQLIDTIKNGNTN